MSVIWRRYGGIEMNQDLKLMCVLAHPDDESLGLGFTLAKYAAEGVRICLVTATRGERGWGGRPEDNPGLEGLGRIREGELRRAVQKLGVEELVFLDYIDGDVDQADGYEAAGKIASEVRRFRPQVVVTFDPWGAYGHPDHIAVTQYTQAGMILAADDRFADPAGNAMFRVSKFYYSGDTQKFVKVVQEMVGGIEFDVDGIIRSHFGWPEWALTTQIDGTAYWDQVMDAIACHETQVTGLLPGLRKIPERYGPQAYSIQYFYRVHSFVNSGRVLERDLFEGLR